MTVPEPLCAPANVVPPFRFALVEDGLYRGSYPRARNLPFLVANLRIRTVVSLTPDPLLPDTLATFHAAGVTCIHHHVAKPKEGTAPMTPPALLHLLVHAVLDPTLAPLYIHCLDGQIVTGAAIMALRKLQGWAMPSIYSEHARFIRGDVISPEETELITKLSGELDLCTPRSGSVDATATSTLIPLPKWLWANGTPTSRRHPYHPAIRLKLPPPPPVAADASTAADAARDAANDKEQLKSRLLTDILMAPTPTAATTNAPTATPSVGGSPAPISSSLTAANALGGSAVLAGSSAVPVPTASGGGMSSSSTIAVGPTASGPTAATASLSVATTVEALGLGLGLAMTADPVDMSAVVQDFLDNDDEEEETLSRMVQALNLEGLTG
ncbi:hypothetical protein AMAG_06609 [Allomyces macrogynus ATCC 38327]|uniref:Tyrosine specific protein phosphatases domain-containing protein n=1 Tax=Allomyces macrogynus (strain ATCC 38327) TaxID=578462 RepID=A0A0L0SE80_ALLM3|nr:hypothetical protein AMAG_06609 [Allomyces macrogynus ATCC 38327]|eukprot:KNE60843.1 hypothetical protein AMAG_06609 [Allomyces macrogynus ATCC 38327]